MNRSKFFLRCMVDGFWFDYETHNVPFWDLAIIIFNNMIKNNFYENVQLWETDTDKSTIIDEAFSENPYFKGEVKKSNKQMNDMIAFKQKLK